MPKLLPGTSFHICLYSLAVCHQLVGGGESPLPRGPCGVSKPFLSVLPGAQTFQGFLGIALGVIGKTDKGAVSSYQHPDLYTFNASENSCSYYSLIIRELINVEALDFTTDTADFCCICASWTR